MGHLAKLSWSVQALLPESLPKKYLTLLSKTCATTSKRNHLVHPSNPKRVNKMVVICSRCWTTSITVLDMKASSNYWRKIQIVASCHYRRSSKTFRRNTPMKNGTKLENITRCKHVFPEVKSPYPLWVKLHKTLRKAKAERYSPSWVKRLVLAVKWYARNRLQPKAWIHGVGRVEHLHLIVRAQVVRYRTTTVIKLESKATRRCNILVANT